MRHFQIIINTLKICTQCEEVKHALRYEENCAKAVKITIYSIEGLCTHSRVYMYIYKQSKK